MGSATEEQSGTPPDPGLLASVVDLNVTFSRGGRPLRALRGITLSLAPGEILGVVGESGSGKSVLGLSLLGLLPSQPAPTISGSVRVHDVDMLRAPAVERRALRRRHLGAVFQDPMSSLNPTMRIGRQLREVAGSDEEGVRLLDAVGVPEARRRLKSYPHELSGGLRQRVMIAMAIAGEPSLVVADEPTTALDVTVQAQILELLRQLCDETGCAFVLVTHDLGVAAEIADRVAVLYGGRLAEVGRAAAVLEHPSHPYTIGLLRSRLTLRSSRAAPLQTLPGEPPDPRDHPPGCAFGPRCALHTAECDVALPELVPSVGHDGTVACVNRADASQVAEQPVQLTPWDAAPVTNRPAVVAVGASRSFVLRSGFRRRESLHALRGIDLTINEGQSVALVGESGCGKSTLLRGIAGLLPVDSGSIELGLGGRPQMVFQDAGASLTPWLTVGELLSERLREERMTKAARIARVAEALQLVGLPDDVAAAKPPELSGGQRQRVALARATVVPPEVLLCDEPTSALDVSLAATVLNLLGRLRRDLGMAILFVTHDLAAARIVADQVAVMYLGRVVEFGPADEVTSNPRHPYTRALLSAVPGAGRSSEALPGEPASPLDPPPGCAFHPRCPDAIDRCETVDPALQPDESGARQLACDVNDVNEVTVELGAVKRPLVRSAG